MEFTKWFVILEQIIAGESRSLANRKVVSIFASVAQGIERLPPEQKVGGSNPPGRVLFLCAGLVLFTKAHHLREKVQLKVTANYTLPKILRFTLNKRTTKKY